MGGPAVTYPSTAVSLAYRGGGERGEESDDDVEAAEVVGKSWLEDRKTDVLYLIRSSGELVIEKEEGE